jgi:hypothetical protein
MRWTHGRTTTISTVMANRLFLTLLALLTGLAAQIAPAQARVRAEQTAAAIAPAAIAVRAPAGPIGLARLPEQGRRQARRVATPISGVAVSARHAPSVRIQVDRARE